MHKRLLLTLFILACSTLAIAQSAAGTIISNTALGSFDGTRTVSSNEVTAEIAAFCALNVSPSNTSTAPAYSQKALAGETHYFSYLIENLGTLNSTYLFTLNLAGSLGETLSPDSVKLILDSNNNSLFDEGETELTELTLNLAQQARVLVAVTFPNTDDTHGLTEINLSASCESDPAVEDTDNTAVVTIPQGGVRNLVKRSSPESGSLLLPGAALRYSISFDVPERSLTNVLLSDVLDENLDIPELEAFVNGEAAGELSFARSSRTVEARFTTLEPGDRVELVISTFVLASALADVIIPNQADLTHDDGADETNEVTHSVAGFCGVSLTPDGDSLNPAHEARVFANERFVFPYLLVNTGNDTHTFDLSLVALNDSSLEPLTRSLIHDLNQDGLVSEGEPQITSVELAAGASAELLLVMEVGDSPSGELDLDVTAECQSDPSIKDETNVTKLSLGVEGASAPQKSSDPAHGTPVHPGAALTYFIDFKANDKDLIDVVVTDTLSEYLEEPVSFTNGTITDPITGLSTNVVAVYENNQVIWRFERVPATMNINLELKVLVRADLSFEEAKLLENKANISIEGNSKDTNTTSNTVVHEIRPLTILLEKTAFPDTVAVGEPLTYTLTIINPSDSVNIEKLELTDDLPEEISYIVGSSKLHLPDGSESSIVPNITGQKLVWTLPGLAIGESLKVVFQVTVLAQALNVEEIINTAGVVASDTLGRATADAAAAANTVIAGGGFRAPAVLMGTVYIDANDNNQFDAADLPVEGVRLYLSDGRAILSDADGRYTFLSLEPGIEILKVDKTSLPARFLKETKTELKDGLWRIKLTSAQITRQDVPLLPAGARLAVDQILNVYIGPVTVRKHIQPLEDGSYLLSFDISSTEALKELELQDDLAGTFTLGDVAAGFSDSFELVLSADDLELLYQAPAVRWRLR